MKNIADIIDCNEFLKALDSYKPDLVNGQPMTELQLLKNYDNYTAPVLKYAKLLMSDNVFPLGNEARAMFGHLADYRLQNNGKINLEDAYGHYRRLNIDVLKILCDEFDKFFLSELKHTYHYDFRNVRADYLKNFAEKYFAAKKIYMHAKYKEHVGSDRHDDIISDYYAAVYQYAGVYKFYQNNQKGLKEAKHKAIAKYAAKLLVGVLGIVLSFLEM